MTKCRDQQRGVPLVLTLLISAILSGLIALELKTQEWSLFGRIANVGRKKESSVILVAELRQALCIGLDA